MHGADGRAGVYERRRGSTARARTPRITRTAVRGERERRGRRASRRRAPSRDGERDPRGVSRALCAPRALDLPARDPASRAPDRTFPATQGAAGQVESSSVSGARLPSTSPRPAEPPCARLARWARACRSRHARTRTDRAPVRVRSSDIAGSREALFGTSTPQPLSDLSSSLQASIDPRGHAAPCAQDVDRVDQA